MIEVLEPTGLGPLLLRARRSRARSQQRLAEELCAVAGLATVSRHEISRWEREDRIPSPYWLAWLSVVLDVPLPDLERAAAFTRGRRGRFGARGRARRIEPGEWPWRLIAAYAVAAPDGGIRLGARPSIDNQHRPPVDKRARAPVDGPARPTTGRRDRLRSSREPNSDGPG